MHKDKLSRKVCKEISYAGSGGKCMEQEGVGMSGDLISRKAAVQMLMEKSYGYVVSLFPTSDECKTAREIAKECAEAVRQMPAVDAEPVRHAKWEEYPDRAHIRCTGCRVEFKKKKMPMSRVYCPNCGAKMRCNDETE